MAKRRRKFTAEEKVAILRRHLIDGVAVSDLCDEHGLNPTVFYNWQKVFFENATAAFESRNRGNARERKLEAARKRRAAMRRDSTEKFLTNEREGATIRTVGETEAVPQSRDGERPARDSRPGRRAFVTGAYSTYAPSPSSATPKAPRPPCLRKLRGLGQSPRTS